MRHLLSIKASVLNLLQRALVRDSLWMLLSHGSSIFMQAAYFILLARTLGSEEYGKFVAVAALAAVVSPIAGLGGGDLLIKNASRDRSLFQPYWGSALLLLGGTSTVLIALVMLLAPVILPNSISPLTTFLILSADLVGIRVIELCMAAFVAYGRVKKAAQVKFLLSFSKLIAAAILFFYAQSSNAIFWAGLYCLSNIIVAFISIFMVNKVGLPRLDFSLFKPAYFREGFHFSVTAASAVVSANADKTLLVSLANPTVAGIYGAAYRFIDVGSVAMYAVSGATYYRFFQHGVAGIKGSLGFAKRLFPFVLLYGAVSTTGYLLFAPLVPQILGVQFTESVDVVRWLAPIHLILFLQVLFSDSLAGAGFQGLRSGIQAAAACANIALNFWLIPLYSWKGAVWATLISDTAKLVCLAIAAAYLYRRQIQALRTMKS